jgi:ribosomal protein S18 acetylase RimI-like enzyme
VYARDFYALDGNRPVPARIREYTRADFPDLIQIQRECFPPPFPSELWWNEEQLTHHVTLFPEGAHCIEIDGAMAGSITGTLVRWSPTDPDHTWAEFTDRGYIRNLDRAGDTLYIVDISVRPSFRRLGLGKFLMQSMYDVVIAMRLKRLLGGARMPGYHKVADHMSPEEYLATILTGERQDPIITFLLRCGRVPVRVAPNYLDDEESRNYAVLMEWRNPFEGA